MKINTETKQTSQVEIPVPSYLVNFDQTEYIGLLDEKTMISITTINDLIIVSSSNPSTSSFSQEQLVKAHSTFHGCCEFQFIEKFDEAIASIYKHEKLAV
jgi:hypothetical protein